LRDEIAEVVYRELGDMVNRDYLIDGLASVVAAWRADRANSVTPPGEWKP
jgi:hypothetical protein